MAGPESAGCHAPYSLETRKSPPPPRKPEARQVKRCPPPSRSKRNPKASGSAPDLIAIFVKHTFEGFRKRDLGGLPRALAIAVEVLAAELKPPIGIAVVIFAHQVPGLLAFAEPDFLGHIPGQEPVHLLLRHAHDHGLEPSRVGSLEACVLAHVLHLAVLERQHLERRIRAGIAGEGIEAVS